MSYWNSVVKSILNKKRSCHSYNFSSDDSSGNKPPKKKKKKKFRGSYPVGDKYPNISFTRREAECMVHLLKGKTLAKIASVLKLSSRTIEYYVNNMKTKLNCHSKYELIGKVSETTFLNTIDFV